MNRENSEYSPLLLSGRRRLSRGGSDRPFQDRIQRRKPNSPTLKKRPIGAKPTEKGLKLNRPTSGKRGKVHHLGAPEDKELSVPECPSSRSNLKFRRAIRECLTDGMRVRS